MSERSEQWCFEIMNMNDKHSYSLLMCLVDFSPEFSAEKIFHNFFQKFFSPEFSAEKIFHNFFQKFFSPEFSAEKIFQNFFSKIFFSRIFSGKNFSKIFFSRIFSGKNFSQFFSPEFSAEYFFRITQRNPRIEFIGISFPFNQGFLFFLVAAKNFFNSKNILICLLQFCFVK